MRTIRNYWANPLAAATRTIQELVYIESIWYFDGAMMNFITSLHEK